MMHNFRKLQIWHLGIEIAEDVYRLCATLPNVERFNLISQMYRSSISIPSNIAEGAGRNSYKEFIRFVSIATGSSYELETQIVLGCRLNYFNHTDSQAILKKITELQKKLFKFKKTLERSL